MGRQPSHRLYQEAIADQGDLLHPRQHKRPLAGGGNSGAVALIAHQPFPLPDGEQAWRMSGMGKRACEPRYCRPGQRSDDRPTFLSQSLAQRQAPLASNAGAREASPRRKLGRRAMRNSADSPPRSTFQEGLPRPGAERCPVRESLGAVVSRLRQPPGEPIQPRPSHLSDADCTQLLAMATQGAIEFGLVAGVHRGHVLRDTEAEGPVLSQESVTTRGKQLTRRERSPVTPLRPRLGLLAPSQGDPTPTTTTSMRPIGALRLSS